MRSGWWYDWDLSWWSTTAFGARQTGVKTVSAWAEPLLDAFAAGAWMLFWTPTTLYWFSKPTVRKEQEPRRLHCLTGPALECDIENLYFVHGVLVPAYAVVKPEWITLEEIQVERNIEVRRVLIERFGMDRYLAQSGAKEIHTDDFGTLYLAEMKGDEPLVMVKVVNSTPEPDGSFRDYFIRVPPEMKRAREAVAWTFGQKEQEYAPAIQT